MRNRVRTIQAACILGLGVLSGCASLLPPSPLAPVLLADPADVTLIEALAHEQYTRVESCDARKSCPQDHYTRGLIALFQSRERAVASFQQVRSEAPNSRLATVSTSWIDLLQASGSGLSFLTVQSPGVPKVTEDFVWEALEREFDGANESVRGLFSERAKRVGGLTDRRPLTSQSQAMSPKDTDQAMSSSLTQATPRAGADHRRTGPADSRHVQSIGRPEADRGGYSGPATVHASLSDRGAVAWGGETMTF